MPAAGKGVGNMRPTHKGGVVAQSGADLLDGTARQHRTVGGGEAPLWAESQLQLTGTKFDFL